MKVSAGTQECSLFLHRFHSIDSCHISERTVKFSAVAWPGLLQGIQGAINRSKFVDYLSGDFSRGDCLCYMGYGTFIGRNGSVASMLYAEPVVAIIVAWLWLQEFPSILSIIGGIVAITSVIIVNWIGIKRRAILRLIEII